MLNKSIREKQKILHTNLFLNHISQKEANQKAHVMAQWAVSNFPFYNLQPLRTIINNQSIQQHASDKHFFFSIPTTDLARSHNANEHPFRTPDSW